MYRYDHHDRASIRDHSARFLDQTRRHIEGALTVDEFRPLRLQNGLYIGRQGPMLRIAVPYGQISSRQLRALAAVAREHARGIGHFTTRHNFQINGLEMSRVPEILAGLAEADLHSIHTSGAVIRNIVTDPFAGISADETADPRPWAELLRQWSLRHPEFTHLPRKFKIAVSGAAEDRAAIRVHDLGLQLVRNADGDPGFRVFAGGGLGREPMLAEAIRDFLPWPHLLTYTEALLRIFDRHGRRDKPHKARLKILVKTLGVREFTRRVEAAWRGVMDGPETLTDAGLARVSAHFAPPAYENLPADDLCYLANLREDAAFARWVGRNVRAHRAPGYAAVTLSLKKPGSAPGDATAEQLEAVADLAGRYGFGEARVSAEQNLILPDVPKRELYTVWHRAKAAGLAAPVTGLIADVTACPGGDFCELANSRTLPVVEAIRARFEDLDYQHDIGELDLNISGCMNGCAHHSLGHIGILGVEKHGETWYQVSLGGGRGDDMAIGEVIGPAFSADGIADVVERIVDVYLDHRIGNERFIDTLHRIGPAPFRDAAYRIFNNRSYRHASQHVR
ncbi:MAG: nitrite/sulfite reductase [Candidatus Nitricoxidivorans perseverans]|uniref:Nitrite/sulfite reductase n=1 Tax=Candidatus Nitricoxidivorans perseverans TaxID=2975601 RepID=A0AA49FLQ8_9PROT|nr:MAG: nitrite/sulfite reductase [Candidatus Nitricoxidivorans perseverans]